MTGVWHDVRILNAAANGLFAASLAACLVTAMWWLSQRPMFTIRQIVVTAPPAESLSSIHESTLKRLPVDQLAGNFFFTDLRNIRAVFETHPWVRMAKVRRVWPDTLVVEVDEHRPFALWNGDRLLNTYGESFAANPADVEEERPLPRLSGPDGEERRVQGFYLDLVRALVPLSLHPEVVELSERRAWRASLSDGTELLFGRDGAVGIAERLASWLEMRSAIHRRLPGQPLTVDLRYPAGFAIRVASAQTGAEAVRAGQDTAARSNRASSGTRP